MRLREIATTLDVMEWMVEQELRGKVPVLDTHSFADGPANDGQYEHRLELWYLSFFLFIQAVSVPSSGRPVTSNNS